MSSNQKYNDCRKLVEAFEKGNTEEMEAVADLPNVGESEETETGSYEDVSSTNVCGSGYILDPDDGSCVPLCESGRCFEILKKYKNDKKLYKRLSKTEQDKIKTLITVIDDKNKSKTVKTRSSNQQLKIGKYSSSSGSVQSNSSRHEEEEESPDITFGEESGITFEDEEDEEGKGIQFTGSKIDEEPFGSKDLFDTTSVNSKTSDISDIFEKPSQGSRMSIHSQKSPSFQMHNTTPQSTRLSIHSILDENPSHHSFKSHISEGRRSSGNQFNIFDNSEPNPPSRRSSRTSNDIKTCLFLLKEENERRKQNNEQLLSISPSTDIDKLLQSSKKTLRQTIKTGQKIKECDNDAIHDPRKGLGKGNSCIKLSEKKQAIFKSHIVNELGKNENYLDNLHTEEDRQKVCKYLRDNKKIYGNLAKNKCSQYIGGSRRSSGIGLNLTSKDDISIASQLQHLSDKIQSSRHSKQHSSHHSRHDDASDSYSLFLAVHNKHHNDVQNNIQKSNKCTGNKIKNPLSGKCIEIDNTTFNKQIKDYLLNEDCAMYKNAFSREDQAKLQRKFQQLKNCH
jgi:hypothetical protein